VAAVKEIKHADVSDPLVSFRMDDLAFLLGTHCDSWDMLSWSQLSSIVIEFLDFLGHCFATSRISAAILIQFAVFSSDH
jgi:hypothetical protein